MRSLLSSGWSPVLVSLADSHAGKDSISYQIVFDAVDSLVHGMMLQIGLLGMVVYEHSVSTECPLVLLVVKRTWLGPGLPPHRRSLAGP